MGCLQSAAGPALAGKPPRAAGAAAKPAQAPAAKPKVKRDPADFVISKRTGEAIVKEEGSIDGEQFNIEECKDCDIFLLDVAATIFVDVCENCRIFVGPVESSIFIRNCRACDMVIACQQFRLRDCMDCRFALFCTTEPVIETSRSIQFACFEFNYFSLRRHLERAGLKLWNNKWWQIHDFNRNDSSPNWSLLPQAEARSLLRPKLCPGVSEEELEMERVIPVTLGSRPWPCQESCFVIFMPDSDEFIEAFLAKASRTDGWTLCRTRSTVLLEDRLKALLSWTKERRLVDRCKGRELTGVEVCGPGMHGQVEDAVAGTGLAAGSKSIHIVPEQETPSLAKAFFETWKDEI